MTSAWILAALLATAPGERVLVDRIVAIVNDDVVTLSEVETAAKPFLTGDDTPDRIKLLHKDVLDQLISERLLTQQIKEAKLSVTDEEADRAIQDILRQNNITDEQLRQAVETRGMTMARYRADLKDQLLRLKLIDMKVRSRVVVPESDIKEEYERRTRDQVAEEVVEIRHIFLRYDETATEEEKAAVVKRAEAARRRVTEGGETFADVAREVSEGPTASTGGDLGEMSGKGLLPELKTALKGLEPGAISTPVKTPNGVHVVELVNRRLKKETDYAEMRDRIYQELYQRRVDEQTKIWLDELRGQSAVKVRL